MSLRRLAGQEAELEAKRPGHYRPYFVDPAPNLMFKVCRYCSKKKVLQIWYNIQENLTGLEGKAPGFFFKSVNIWDHTSANFITMLVTRAIASFSKNHTLLMCRIWKMGRNLVSSLDIRDNLKVAFLGKNSTNPSINLVTGSDFMELSSLCNCITVGALAV